jgi:hypothetical protein
VSHLVTEEAQAQLDAWPKKARALFHELLDDAGSELQRELLQRAVAAGHTPAEVHAFADELRALSDEEAYEACTLHDAAPEDYTVAQLLRAEADPLFAFELRGGTLEPNETVDTGPGVPLPARGRPRAQGFDEAPPEDPLVLALARKKPSESFEAESEGARAEAWDWNALGGSAPPPPTTSRPAAGGPRLLEGLLAEATRGLGVSWREHDVDVPGGLTLEEALATAAGALTRGIPVPCAIGQKPGEHRRFVLVLQLSTSGRNRAWQLYDPFARELVWANEGDLLARSELPFASKVNRRLTRIVLPQNVRAAF